MRIFRVTTGEAVVDMHGPKEAMDESRPPRPVANERGVIELTPNETNRLENLLQKTVPDPTGLLP